ncbi:MAG: glucokinase [Candidatus Kariarchaeaceae archaeon]
MLLAGDVGATKTDLAVFSEESLKPLVEKRHLNNDFRDFTSLIHHFLEEIDYEISSVCIGVAGPVIDGEVKITNWDWSIKETTLMDELSVENLKLLNDLEALCHYIPALQSSEIFTLHTGNRKSKHNIAVLGIGTGLGQAFMTWNGIGYDVHPSEGGHCDFAPKNQLQIELLQYLQDKYDQIDVDKLCSAIGIRNIVSFFHNKGLHKQDETFASLLFSSKDLAREVINNARSDNPHNLSLKTMNLLATILASEIGNVALKLLPYSGIYLGGGIPPQIIPFLQSNHFQDAFYGKGPLNYLMKNFPLHVILNSKASMLGAAKFGFSQYFKSP